MSVTDTVTSSEVLDGCVPPRATARLLLRAIGCYQGLRAGRPTGCRYLPTCSEYADESIRRFGAVRGTRLAVRRLSHCHPWGGHGIDPVPDRSDPWVR